MDALLPEWLWPIALFGGLGAFMDLLLARVGQQRKRDFLQDLCLRFDEIKWCNFGRHESFLVVFVMDQWCGSKLFSTKRWVFVISVSVIAICLGYIIAFLVLVFSQYDENTPYFKLFGPIDPTGWQIVPLMIIASFALAISLSITRAISMLVVRFLNDGAWKNGIVFLGVIGCFYIFMVYWHSITKIIESAVYSYFLTYDLTLLEIPLIGYLSKWNWYAERGSVILPIQLLYAIASELHDDFTISGASLAQNAVRFELDLLGYIGNMARLAIAVVFFVTFLSKPFMRSKSRIWLRVAGSHKPIFTLVLGGVASIVVAAAQIAKRL